MKKVFYSILAVSCLVACSKASEEAIPVQKKTTISVGIDLPQTKTELTGNVDILWSAGDDVAVDTESGIKVFTLESGSGSASGTFSINEDVTVKSSATSFYPASMSPSWNSVDEKWHVNLPATYEWAENQVQAPMYAWLNGSWNYFRLLTSVIKVDIYNIPADASKLVFTTVGEVVSGDYAFDGDCLAVVAGTSNNSITINFTAGDAADRTFFIPVPYGSYTAGATFVLKNASDEALVTKTAPAITVGKQNIVYLPAITCSAVSTVLWNGTHVFDTWADWDSVPARAIKGIWRSFKVGDVLKMTLSGVTSDAYLKMSYKKEDWSWSALFEGSISEGATEFEHTLTAEDLTNLSIHDYIVASAKNLTITKIEVLDNRPEVVIWKGSFDVGDTWGTSHSLTDLNTSMWANVTAGKVLTVYYSEKSIADSWRPLQLQYMKDNSWTTFAEGSHNADGTEFYSYKLSDTDVSNLKSYGLAINGLGLIINKVTIK